MKPKVMSLVLVAALLFSVVSMALVSTPASAVPATLHVRQWVKNSTAVLPVGASGFDANGVAAPSIIKDGSTYKMWYTGRSGSTGLGTLSIGYATSSDGTTWSKTPTENSTGAAVLSGTASAWDSDVSFATVIQESSTSYKMWYTGRSGTTGSNVSKIGYATSTNGVSWTKSTSNPVLTVGASTSWEAMGIGVPFVLKESSTSYKMWYTGMKSNLVPSIGYATSTDGITWTKFTTNPVMTGDVGGASVIKESDVYRMWYTTRDALGVLQIGYASSNNGTSWVKAASADLTASNAFEGPGTGGVGSAFAMKDGTVYKLWYTGLSSSLVPTIGYAAPTAGGSNYATIQAAIGAAATTDTIIVHAGTYAEQLTVASALTGLTIKSADIATMPVINGTGFNPAVTISASGVTFKGFIVSGSTDRGIRLASTATGAMISYNCLTGTTTYGAGVFNGLVDETATSTTYAYMNYWGSASGPAGIGGGGGSGLLSSNSNITYAPWLTQHPLTWLQDSLGYLGDFRVLSSGWNLVSTPFALDSAGDTLGEIVALGDGLNIDAISPVYYFVASTQTWTQATSTYVLNPVDAVYVKMAAQDKILLLASTSVSAPAKSLSAGWNLFSLSSSSPMLVSSALNSLSTNYSYVISPPLGQADWAIVYGGTASLNTKEGYWVYMKAAANLGGFTLTPLGANIPSTW